MVGFAKGAPHGKVIPLQYGPYTITKAMGEDDFELSIQPLLCLHPICNVELLQPYFPPLLDTLKAGKLLAPINFNLDYIEQDKID